MITDLAALGVLTVCEEVVAANAASPQAVRLVPVEALVEPFDLSGVADELGRHQTLLLAQPELRLLELLAETGYGGRVVTFVPSVLSEAQRLAVEANVPADLNVETCFSYEDPPGLSVFGSAFVAVAFRGGSDQLVLHSWSARLLRRWHEIWFGARIFVNPISSVVRTRLDGWESLSLDRHDTVLDPRSSELPSQGTGA